LVDVSGGLVVAVADHRGQLVESLLAGASVAAVRDTPKPLWCNVKTQNPDMKVVLSQSNFIRVLRRR
jgi:hypothetical protein